MWALLEDENGTSGNQPSTRHSLSMPTGSAVPNEINEQDMENYSKLSGRSLRFPPRAKTDCPSLAGGDELPQDFVPQPRLSSIVGTQIAMNWVGEPLGSADEQANTDQAIPQNARPIPKEEESNALPTPRAKSSGFSRFAPPMPISINATKAQDYWYRPRRNSVLAMHEPLSPIDGVYTPSRPYATTPLQTLYQASEIRKGERRPSETSYMPYPQSFPNDFTDQPQTYEYRFMTPRTATFRDTPYAPLSMSAPLERWDGIAWQDPLVVPDPERYREMGGR